MFVMQEYVLMPNYIITSPICWNKSQTQRLYVCHIFYKSMPFCILVEYISISIIYINIYIPQNYTKFPSNRINFSKITIFVPSSRATH